MQARNRNSLVSLLSAALVAASIQSAAYGGVIGTEEYLNAIDREAAIARIDAVLARDEVRKSLEHYGVDPAAATARVAALTDQELQTLATDPESLPAGGDLLAVAGMGPIDGHRYIDICKYTNIANHRPSAPTRSAPSSRSPHMHPSTPAPTRRRLRASAGLLSLVLFAAAVLTLSSIRLRREWA